MLVAVDFSPRKRGTVLRRVATFAGERKIAWANVATRRTLSERIPWTKVHGYRHGVAPRLTWFVDLYFDSTQSGRDGERT